MKKEEKSKSISMTKNKGLFNKKDVGFKWVGVFIMSTHGDEALDDVEVEKFSQVKIKPKKYSTLLI